MTADRSSPLPGMHRRDRSHRSPDPSRPSLFCSSFSSSSPFSFFFFLLIFYFFYSSRSGLVWPGWAAPGAGGSGVKGVWGLGVEIGRSGGGGGGRGGGDWFEGEWVWDERYPLYESRDCWFLDEGFRCSENGRRDRFYTKWRWQPAQCDLPRFDAKKMLEKLRNRRLVFVGDSMRGINGSLFSACFLWLFLTRARSTK